MKPAQPIYACAVIVGQYALCIVPSNFPPLQLSLHSFILLSIISVVMDNLVSTYSRSAFEDEGYSSDEQQELVQAKPPLSLRFAMPPMANVSSPKLKTCFNQAENYPALCLPPSLDRRPCKSELPHKACPWHNHISIPIPRWHHSSDRLKSHSRQLDCESDGQESHRD